MWPGGANARTYRHGHTGAPVTSVRRGRHYFGCRQPRRQGYGGCLRFVDTVNASDAPDRPDTPPTRHALASKPTSSTEWQLGTLNGLVGVVVVGANARTYGSADGTRLPPGTQKRRGGAISRSPDTPDASMYADF